MNQIGAFWNSSLHLDTLVAAAWTGAQVGDVAD